MYIALDLQESFQKVLSLSQILYLSYTSYICMGLNCTEIKTEIWINQSSFIRSDSVLP